MKQIIQTLENFTKLLKKTEIQDEFEKLTPEIKQKFLEELQRALKPLTIQLHDINIKVEAENAWEKEKMIFVGGGIFNMGSDNPKDAKQIELDSYYIGAYQITFEEFDEFCMDKGRELKDDNGFGRGRRPVINISWPETIEFCNWKSEKAGFEPCYSKSLTKPIWNKNSKGYRLLTEAEWEYAAQGGLLDKEWGKRFSGGQFLDEFGWSKENSEEKTHPVGIKQPNELGIFDMSGNVWEWCYDYYTESFHILNITKNPSGPDYGNEKVIRGGSYYHPFYEASVFYRNCAPSLAKFPYIGFRVCRSKI